MPLLDHPKSLKELTPALKPGSVRPKPSLDRGIGVPVQTSEFWTSRQRQASAIHEVSYRACYKPQLPRYFIERMTRPGDWVYDPFMGRGTTLLESALLGRLPIGNDINPLSEILCRPRLRIPSLAEIEKRLWDIPWKKNNKADIDLTMFFEKRTLQDILSLRAYLKKRHARGSEDHIDRWIRMVATNRLTGHSPGFFSVYTLPPNQAGSQAYQIKVNKARKQVPPYRDVRAVIIKKTRSLLKGVSATEVASLNAAGKKARFLNVDARKTKKIASNSVQLTVTSPPFLDIVSYAKDNWMRCWFNSLDADRISSGITMSKKLDDWTAVMQSVFFELYRITKPGGYVAFEVGEIKKGTIKLDRHIVPVGKKAGFSCFGVLINSQQFTKTANIWGISNNSAGTNTNRIVVFQKRRKA